MLHKIGYGNIFGKWAGDCLQTQSCVIQAYLSIADMLYSGHHSIADTIAGSRRITHFLHIKIPLYSGQLYSRHLVIADTFWGDF